MHPYPDTHNKSQYGGGASLGCAHVPHNLMQQRLAMLQQRKRRRFDTKQLGDSRTRVRAASHAREVTPSDLLHAHHIRYVS